MAAPQWQRGGAVASSGPEVPSMELLRKWKDGKARRELTDFLSGLGVNHVGLSDVSDNDFAKVSVSPDLACEASNADRSITRSKILSRAAKASGVKGRRSQNDSDSHSLANDVRHALAFIAAEGLRAEEVVMSKMSNLPPLSAAYQALRERAHTRKQAAMLSCTGRLLMDNAKEHAEALCYCQSLVGDTIGSLHANHTAGK